MLPVLLLLAGFVIDIGMLFCANSLAYSAADMASLAAVQDLDLEQLADGTRYIIPDQARADAEAFLAENILSNWSGLRPTDITAAISVYNPSGSATQHHAANGRHIHDPTVCVQVSFPVKLRFISSLFGQVRARAHADASVVPKSGS